MNLPHVPRPPFLDWSAITTVLLDMDGTLLDKHFDDYFWEEYVPHVFAKRHGIEKSEAQTALLRRYQAVEDTLLWTDLDFWSEQLDLDIPKLKGDIDHLISVLPHVHPFLDFLALHGKEICLVTAAHHKTLAIKLQKTDLAPLFSRIINTEEIGLPKETPDFWQRLEGRLGFNRSQTMLADDTVKVLHAARLHGIEHLVHIAKPSSQRHARPCADFISISSFADLLP